QGANSWLGVDASGISLSLALDPLSVSVTGGELKLNRASGAGTSKLDWDSFAAQKPLAGLPLPQLDVDHTLDLHIARTVAAELSGIFPVTADGSVDPGQVTVAETGTNGADGDPAVTAGFVRGTPAQATVLQLAGSASAGGSSVAVNVKLVSLTQGANSWLGVDATGINLSLALDPLSVSVTGGELKLNRATGTGTQKLDWDSFASQKPL